MTCASSPHSAVLPSRQPSCEWDEGTILASFYLRSGIVPPSSGKGRYIAPRPGGILETCGKASFLSSCLHLCQVAGRLEPPSFRCSLPVFLLPETSGLPWRHPPFGLTACCMPLSHCVGTLHPHHHCCRLHFGCRANCRCPPN